MAWMNKATPVAANTATTPDYSGVRGPRQQQQFLNCWTSFSLPRCSYSHTVHWFPGWIRLRCWCWCRNPAEQCAAASLERTQGAVNFGLCSGNLSQREGHLWDWCLLKWDSTCMHTKPKYSPLMLDLSDHSNAGVSLIVWSGTRRCDVKKQIGERAPVAPFKLLQENCWQSSLRGCHLSLTSSAQSSEHNLIILGKAEDFRTSWLSNRGTNFTALLITRQNSGQSNRSFALAVTLPHLPWVRTPSLLAIISWSYRYWAI